ncbi:MAG TPA: SURF1 family protein [Rhodopila sp.]|nr:SURF1 family protein [Rhodopila sp.]
MRPWRRLLAPGLSATLALALLIALGTWQVYRLHWKEGILARIAASEAGPPVPLSASASPYQKVSVSGRFRYDQAVWFGAEVRDLGAEPQMGYFQIVPLERADGPPILVDRGWVPDTAAAPVVNPPGLVTVQGYVRPAQGHAWFQPSDNVAGKHFYTLDPRAIAAALHLPPPMPFVIVALGPDDAGVYPAPAQHLPRPPNNHLSYAITWYGLAVALVVIFGVWARNTLRA